MIWEAVSLIHFWYEFEYSLLKNYFSTDNSKLLINIGLLIPFATDNLTHSYKDNHCTSIQSSER